MKYTKIVATISDRRCDVEFIRQLYEAGMNVARLNTAHISTESALTMEAISASGVAVKDRKSVV